MLFGTENVKLFGKRVKCNLNFLISKKKWMILDYYNKTHNPFLFLVLKGFGSQREDDCLFAFVFRFVFAGEIFWAATTACNETLLLFSSLYMHQIRAKICLLIATVLGWGEISVLLIIISRRRNEQFNNLWSQHLL